MRVTLTRRAFAGLITLAGTTTLSGQNAGSQDWRCPMDPDVTSDKPGVCPHCGMTLVLHLPDNVEYTLEVETRPAIVEPGRDVELIFRVRDPRTGQIVTIFDVVHEKLIHLFLVSENLEFFAHVHPQFRSDGSFALMTSFPFGGMYRLLTDYYPRGATPQLTVATLYVSGSAPPTRIRADLSPSHAENLSAALEIDPPQALAGMETKLMYTLQPADGLQPYIGAWGHMLAVSEDLIDMMHVHPFIADGGPHMQFNVLFPRAGLYRVWAQFQRLNTVNTTCFTVPVAAI